MSGHDIGCAYHRAGSCDCRQGRNEIKTSGKATEQMCPDCGLILELHEMEYENEAMGPPCSIWLACGSCQVTWEATLEVVKLRRIN